MRVRIGTTLMVALCSLASAVWAQEGAQLSPPGPATEATIPQAEAPPGSAPLTRADVEAWLDGYLPYALQTGGIAGAVVVVVKDGQVLLQKGYGYSDVAARKPVYGPEKVARFIAGIVALGRRRGGLDRAFRTRDFVVRMSGHSAAW